MKQNSILLLSIFLITSLYGTLDSEQRKLPAVFIIIHGTWAKKSPWARSGGDFFTALERSLKDDMTLVTSFTWSGKLDNESRRIAAKDLLTLINTYPAATSFNLIGHSHGANVGILACNELAKNRSNAYTINSFFALAAPVNTQEYMPNMTVINHFYSFFSLNDLVQPVFGIFGRIYPDHQRIANIRIMINGIEPDHAQLHDPCIAQWLMAIHSYCLTTADGYKQPLVIDVTHNKTPLIQCDTSRQELLVEDRKLIAHLATVFRKK